MSVNGTVRDLFLSLDNYPSVRDTASIRDVFARLKEVYTTAEQFRSVLVLDGQGRLVGMLGLRDMLHSLLPDYLKRAPVHYQGPTDDISALALIWQEDCVAQIRQAAVTGKAGDYVTPVPASVRLDDPLTRGILMMAKTAANILPVVEGDRVIGVLRLVDVLAEVTKEVLHG
ncbi:MAG: CBS domain-containing protein [Magnetococcales bacterium]|nr:CBS domain-containing protein [Magnetococcales bacterium]MBF0156446.1 CBS domain-containing protein [Magnetococcales bacterium]